MRFMFIMFLILMVGMGCQTDHTSVQDGPPLLVVVSVDGLNPQDLDIAQQQGFDLPHLTSFIEQGSYATGVVGVIPTVTYPSHATLITGVLPAEHGILANKMFNPQAKRDNAWYWFSEDLQVPTLLDVAKQAGRRTANVQWPVTVGADIDYNIPAYWRFDDANDVKIMRVITTPQLLNELEQALGTLILDQSIEQTQERFNIAKYLLTNKTIDVMLIHLPVYDSQTHQYGHGDLQALATLAELDQSMGVLEALLETITDGHYVLAIVSDHGFYNANVTVHLNALLYQAGLIELDDQGRVSHWDAFAWGHGGGSTIMLAQPDDPVLTKRVEDYLTELANNKMFGIATVLTADELSRMGGVQTGFYVEAEPGYRFSDGLDTMQAIEPLPQVKGEHGQLPSRPAMYSSFLLKGEGIPVGQSLGVINILDIAPTLAGILQLDWQTQGQDVLADKHTWVKQK
ncbi:MAG: alkaline phosphatase family protein [Legionellales bacterium]|nr:alkaline phosphatase family protein [Legionellales bacterium]